MRRILVTAAFAIVLPLSAFASMSGGYGGGGYGMRNGGGSMSDAGREEAQAAIRLIEKEQYGDAIPHLKRALAVMQGNADILNLLGFTERMVGDYPTSLDYYQRALARNPDHKGAHEYLGELYLAMHQPDQARAQLVELDRLCPDPDGCEEKATLKQAIAAYMSANPAGAPAPASPQSSAAPASPQAPAAPPVSSQQQTPPQSSDHQ